MIDGMGVLACKRGRSVRMDEKNGDGGVGGKVKGLMIIIRKSNIF